MSAQNGKGSKPRPFSVPHEVFEENWDRVFSKKNPLPENKRVIEEKERVVPEKKTLPMDRDHL